ncbi:MAG TPA: GSCFA domain-containing protein [Bacteroidales bacterium]|nr:GSCFA domain-containing protein [Bacteroidales bacterium]HOX75063.1 GSCFA domain-containing protein [Bacteroidales bacterium]HPM88275.1 GSCFA domain-containing protein [Bacteroidales bacterium]HQM68482.1 GSCFA domain-containing protein [Bacteroidales bacterium]
MELRTTFEIEPSEIKITYNDPVLFIGSCFATEIGNQFVAGKMPVLINPSGTVYNPVSVCNTLDTITGGKKYTRDDIYNYNGVWLSFNHYTDFSSEDPENVLESINSIAERSHRFISTARFLFITFGTARVYRWKGSGRIVSNCHKIPSSEFTDELLSPSGIVDLWDEELTKLKSLFPSLKVVFTISPVRHWKNGAHGNQVSKSVLFLAVEELMHHPSKPGYFPAYELIMDDLRDYRFYDDDMLHTSSAAINYVWQRFSDCYLDARTVELRNEVLKVTRAFSHRLTSAPESRKIEFARSMIDRIKTIENKIPTIDLTGEKAYFNKILGE